MYDLFLKQPCFQMRHKRQGEQFISFLNKKYKGKKDLSTKHMRTINVHVWRSRTPHAAGSVLSTSSGSMGQKGKSQYRELII
jgi:hypothetical protein